jgi:hypothetical protein
MNQGGLTLEPRPVAPLGVPEHFYRTYGLAIRSELPLPELEPMAPGPEDVTIRFAPTGRPVPATGSAFEFGADTQYLAWSGAGAFRIRGAREIDIERGQETEDRLLALPLLGPVMAMLLHLRGKLVLHASAVASGDRGAIFLGDKRAGKSTTAAALVAAGNRLLTDDVLALDTMPTGGLGILPAYPQIKLARDSAQAIAIDAIVEPRLHHAIDKRQHRLTHGFSHASTAATRIYVLQRGAEAKVTAMPVQTALLALMRFSYVTRFEGAALKGASAAAHLRLCAELASSTGVRQLVIPDGLHRLDELVGLVERDLAEAGS